MPPECRLSLGRRRQQVGVDEGSFPVHRSSVMVPCSCHRPNNATRRPVPQSGSGDGGCPTLSHSFAAGFFWLDQLGRTARLGFDRMFRQDLVGCVFEARVGHIVLGTPTHPSYPCLLSFSSPNVAGPVGRTSATTCWRETLVGLAATISLTPVGFCVASGAF